MDDLREPQNKLGRWAQLAVSLCFWFIIGFFLANLGVTTKSPSTLYPLLILGAVFLAFDLLVLAAIWLIRRLIHGRGAGIFPKPILRTDWRAGLAGIVLGLIGGHFWVTLQLWDKL
jgi:hypothetical protein